MQRRSIRYFMMAGAVVFAACESPSEPAPPPAVEITVSPTELTLQVGQVTPLTASVVNGATNAVIWRSANPAIAMVSASGNVTGVAPGSTFITAIAVADTMKRASATVLVEGEPVPPAPQGISVLGLGEVNERYTAELAVRDNYAYTTSWGFRQAPGNTMRVWNVAGNTPVLVDTVLVQGAGTTGDVQISDDGGLIVVAIENGGSANNGIAIYDRTNPAAPALLSRFSHAETGPGVHTVKLGRVNGRHYAFLSINPGAVGARLMIVDITSPSAPSFVWSERMGTPFVHDVFVRDGILFTALWHDGLRIFDIGGGGRGGSPSAPVVMGNLRIDVAPETPGDQGYIHNIWWFHDPTTGGKQYVFLGEENTQGVGFNTNSSKGDIHVIDVSDMSAPKKVAQYAVTGAGTHNFSMDEQSGILYAAYYNGGVRALDVRGDLGSCAEVQKNAGGYCDLRLMGREAGTALTPTAQATNYVWGVAWQGNHLYASDMRKGLYKLDVSGLRR